MAGHIKLDRKIVNWEWYQDANTCRLFIHLLLVANYKETKWRGYTIKRGQVFTGLNQLNENIGLSVRQLRTSFDKLKMTGEITIQTTNKFRVVTICKYDSYQLNNFDNDNQNDNQNVSKLTSERQANDKPPTTSKNSKEEKEYNTTILSPTGGAFFDLYEKMMVVYTQYFPTYFRDINKDYPACNHIARKIEILKGWEKASCMNGKIDEFLAEWEKMVLRLTTNNWLKKMSLHELSDREWQKWCTSMANAEEGTNSKEKVKKVKEEKPILNLQTLTSRYDT